MHLLALLRLAAPLRLVRRVWLHRRLDPPPSPSAHKSVLESANPRMDSEGAS